MLSDQVEAMKELSCNKLGSLTEAMLSCWVLIDREAIWQRRPETKSPLSHWGEVLQVSGRLRSTNYEPEISEGPTLWQRS
jgi:hypothetical protein